MNAEFIIQQTGGRINNIPVVIAIFFICIIGIILTKDGSGGGLLGYGIKRIWRKR